MVVPAGEVASSPVAALHLGFDGIVGDRHSGLTRRSTSREPWYPRGTVIRNDRQVSIVSGEELAKVAKAMGLPMLDPAWIGANLAIKGIADLSALPPGTRMTFADGAVLKVEAENGPCRVAGRSIAGHMPGREGLDLWFPKAARHKRGLVASVEKPGTIALGAHVDVWVPSIRHPAPEGMLL
jgi:MOSC domain-containing protein YiiM